MLQFFIALAPMFTSGNVLIVDHSGNGDVVTIQEAVDLASDGDTILVRRSERPDIHWGYQQFEIVGKALAVHAIGGGPHFTGPIAVRDIPKGSAVTLSGLDVWWPHADLFQPTDFFNDGIEVENCAGAVRIQNLRVYGYEPTEIDYLGIPSAAVSLVSCADVVIRNCTLRGGAGDTFFGAPGEPGLIASESNVALYDCDLTGGIGGEEGPYPIGATYDGGDGARVIGGTLYSRGSTFEGGRGGSGDTLADMGVGGAGIRLEDGATGAVVDCTLTGGPGASYDNHNPGVEVGEPGPDSVGGVDIYSGPRVVFDSPTMANESGTIQLRFEGTPGHEALLIASSTTIFRSLGPSAGVQHVPSQPNGVMTLGTVPASGAFEYKYSLPAVPSGSSERIYLQGGFESASGVTRLADVVVLDVLDNELRQGGTGRIYVNIAAPDGGDGSSWATAFNDLDWALAVTPTCDSAPLEVWIAKGVYTASLGSFYLYSNTRLLGGFRGDEASASERTIALNETVLEGAGNSVIVGHPGSRSWYGNIPGSIGAFVDTGVDGIRFRNAGGQVRAWGQICVSRCQFEGSAGLLSFGEGRVTQSSFTGIRSRGVFMSSVGGLPVRLFLEQCVFSGNPTFSAIGVRVDAGAHPAVVEVTSCTFVGGPTDCGLAIYHNDLAHEVRVNNSVFWGHRGHPDVQSSQINISPSGGAVPIQIAIDNSCVEGWDGMLGGVGNTGLDPRFRDMLGADGLIGTSDDDLSLLPYSPCIDAGSNAFLPADVEDLDGDGDRGEPLPIDLAGRSRIVDLVLYPWQRIDAFPVVDMGAFEAPPMLEEGAQRR